MNEPGIIILSHRDIEYVINAHETHSGKPGKETRKWDGKTPYWIHPLWCAAAILAETSLDDTVRNEGALVLLYHDILEDTTKPLPEWLSPRTRERVEWMTFEGGSAQEMREVWATPPEIRLYKLYDKVSNLLDGVWMGPEKRRVYEDYTRRLCEDTERNYGDLNITRISRAISHIPLNTTLK